MNHSGYSLIEVTVAMAILGLGLLALTTMLTTAARVNTIAAKETQGVNQARRTMERLLGLAYDHPDLDPAGNPHLDNRPTPGFDVSWIITDGIDATDPAADTKRVTVTVTWQVRGMERNYVVEGVKAHCY